MDYLSFEIFLLHLRVGFSNDQSIKVLRKYLEEAQLYRLEVEAEAWQIEGCNLGSQTKLQAQVVLLHLLIYTFHKSSEAAL